MSIWTLLVPLTVHAAAADSARHSAVEIRPPSNATTNPSAVLASVACAGQGRCVAGGQYADGSDFGQAMVAALTRAGWAQARELHMPADAFVNPNGSITSMACTGPGFCVAVGAYEPHGGSGQGFVVTLSKGKWGRAAQVRLPMNAATRPDAALFGVSCARSGSCSAVGFYATSTGRYEAMAIAESKGRWLRARGLAAPPGAPANPDASLTSVSCSRPGSCMAVGVFTSKTGHFTAMAVSESKGRWHRTVQLALPPNAAANPDASLTSVACTAAGSCVAVGSYARKSVGDVGMAVTESAGRWNRAAELPAPSDSALQHDVTLYGVACAAAGKCGAVGDYLDRAGHRVALRVTEAAGRWGRAAAGGLPPNASTGPDQFSVLYGITCPGRRSCIAVGTYVDVSGNSQAMAVTVALP